MSGGGGSQVVGFRYYFDIHMGLGRGPIDELVAIQVSDRIAWQGNKTTSGTGTIAQPELFGGDAKEGGIEGEFHLLMGEDTQVPPAAVNKMQPSGVVVGFRRMVTLFYTGLVCSINPYPKKWSFRVRRAVKGWDGEVFRPDLAVIGLSGDAVGYDNDDVFNMFRPAGVEMGGEPETVAWSPGGRYLAAGGLGYYNEGGDLGETYSGPYFKVYKRSGSTYTQCTYTGGVPNAQVHCVAFSLNDLFLAVASKDTPYLRVYQRTGDVFALLATPLAVPATAALSAAWSPDSTMLVVGINQAPFIVAYRVTGTTFTRVAADLVPPTYGDKIRMTWSKNGVYLAVTHAIAPFITIYRRSGDNLVKLPPPVILPSGPVNGCDWGVEDTLLTLAQNGTPFVFTYKRTDDTFEKIAPPDVALPNAGTGVAWRPSGGLVAVSHLGLPGLTVYKRSGDTLTKRAALNAAGGSGTAVAWDDTGERIALTHTFAPYLTIYGRKSTDGLSPDTSIRAMNPAHIIFECLTNREWGRGLDRSVINTASFETAALTLKNEGFGLCTKWSRRDSIQTFVQSILDHINATLYTNRETALLTLKLIRGGYVKSSLPLYDTSNGILEIREATTSTTSGAINEVVVTYRDPVLNEDRTVRVQNLASLQSSAGAFNSLAKSYPAIPTADIALRVAQRDLRANAEGLRRFQLAMDRRAWKIAPGDVIRIQDVPRNVPDMVVRVARIEDGTLLDGKITLTVVQDVFTMPGKSFVDRQPNAWEPVTFDPCIGRHEVFEVPYFLLNRTMRPADFAYVDPTSAYLGVVAEKGQPMNSGYSIAVRSGSATPEDTPTNTQAYCGYVPPSA